MKQSYNRSDLNIIVIDDSSVVQMATQYQLEKLNLHATQVYDGEVALDRIKNEYFDLIILDIEIPKYRGTRILSDIKAFDNQEYNKSKIFITTTHQDHGKRDLCLSLGADEYLIKPVHFQGLENLVNKHFAFIN